MYMLDRLISEYAAPFYKANRQERTEEEINGSRRCNILSYNKDQITINHNYNYNNTSYGVLPRFNHK